MARKSYFTGEIIQIRVNQQHLYHRQWAVPRGNKKPYIISETVQREDGSYVRNHEWVCGCMDWISRRQKLAAPYDRCKHIDAAIRMVSDPVDTHTNDLDLFGLIKEVRSVPKSEYGGYAPMVTVNNNWSGANLPFKHIIHLPKPAIPIAVTDDKGSRYPVGYIMGGIAYLGLDKTHLQHFDFRRFFNTLAKRSFAPKESAMLLAMEEQRNRMEKHFGESVTNELQVLEGDLTEGDKQALCRLKESGTIDDFKVIDSSVMLYLNQRGIKVDGKIVWKGDYIVVVGKMVSFSVMGKNIGGTAKTRNGGIHPHVFANGRPCLSGYNRMVVEALQTRNWIKFGIIISDFLTQFNRSHRYLIL